MITKRAFHEIWAVQEGTKKVWKVQAKHGILTFKSKKMAEAWVKSYIDCSKIGKVNFSIVAPPNISITFITRL